MGRLSSPLLQPPPGTVGKQGRAQGEDVLVELDLRVVGGHVAARIGEARRQVEERRGHLRRHGGEVLGRAAPHAVPDREAQLRRVARQLPGQRRVAEERRGRGGEFDLRRAAVDGGDARSRLPEPPLEPEAGLLVAGAEGAAQQRRVRQDVRLPAWVLLASASIFWGAAPLAALWIGRRGETPKKSKKKEKSS